MADIDATAGLAKSQDRRVQAAMVATAMHDRLAAVASTIRDALAAKITELPNDQSLSELLASSVAGNVENILHALRYSIPVTQIEPPSAALEYARRLAQHGTPVNALVRAYRLGQENMLIDAYEECVRAHADPEVRAEVYQQFVSVTFEYVDWISQRVIDCYETERERWVTELNTARFDRVLELIDGECDDIDAVEATIGYRLRVVHLGAVLWVHETGAQEDQLGRFSRVVSAIGDTIGHRSPPLMVPRDRTSAWAWFCVPSEFTLDVSTIRPLIDGAGGPPVPMIAFGRPRAGVKGFRDTHLDAVQARRVAMVRDDPAHPVIGAHEPGLSVAGLLSHDIEQTRSWVQDILGDLARDEEQHERLRETLLLFFRHDNSYTATAEAMLMHKNSVKYRVTSAEKILGRPVSDDRQAIDLALTACHWLGHAVLAP